MNPIELINLHESEFTKSDEKIKKYVLNNLDYVSSYPIVNVAAKAGVSKSALLRFCQKLGYNGYSEFKYEVSKHLLSGSFKDPSVVKSNMDIIENYTNCIKKLPDCISEDSLISLGNYISNASRIRIFGLHESGLSATYFSYRLAALGIDSEAIIYGGIFSEKASFSTTSDFHIFISVSGTTDYITAAAKTSFDRHTPCAIITQNNKARYFNKYDCFIAIPSLNLDKNQLFLDSQAILFITIDLIISKLSKIL
ncbi:MurR/RpiR family transcriptional regulator [Anaerocolumna sp. MB42-C2]|uniref:MurR/RpiR family transcriptional regulator n=1 Tax=Anaerocolumna sp. MB42-C2 TaxID=3070997 RepID=UPI0027E0C661|nr:MurR/RpiR family transcriptional regulator [Anaerocolumna sp. MB42-C2]WMJ86411.1 MurR/RpiR family transcriptional regulator [Anaerocolumna sp. MB42-C2]